MKINLKNAFEILQSRSLDREQKRATKRHDYKKYFRVTKIIAKREADKMVNEKLKK
jgi:hypothetical protein